MAIEAIGADSAPASTAAVQNQSISQKEFIDLFLAQLRFQDPMEPLDNREFLAQLAQFSALEQSRLSNESLQSLLRMNSSSQALTLLGSKVEVEMDTGVRHVGQVEAVHYTNEGPSLTILTGSGQFIDQVSLNQIRIVNSEE